MNQKAVYPWGRVAIIWRGVSCEPPPPRPRPPSPGSLHSVAVYPLPKPNSKGKKKTPAKCLDMRRPSDGEHLVPDPAISEMRARTSSLRCAPPHEHGPATHNTTAP